MLFFRRFSRVASLAGLAAALIAFGASHIEQDREIRDTASIAPNLNWDVVAPDADASLGSAEVTLYNLNWD
ncbi:MULTISPECIES: hypothetical protein [unclassified Streptomyces]|uniref:hypothetical protein n=1 Tax=unclassified Streptomyces TaxID=2593676 RepID=UPI0034429874